MLIHEVFAQISEGEVKNIFVCDNYPTADYLTKCTYGPEAFAVSALQYACGAGDKYHDGCFYRLDPDTGEEVQIPYIPTQEQQVKVLSAENAALQQQLTDTQLALVEIYEGMEV